MNYRITMLCVKSQQENKTEMQYFQPKKFRVAPSAKWVNKAIFSYKNVITVTDSGSYHPH